MTEKEKKDKTEKEEIKTKFQPIAESVFSEIINYAKDQKQMASGIQAVIDFLSKKIDSVKSEQPRIEMPIEVAISQ